MFYFQRRNCVITQPLPATGTADSSNCGRGLVAWGRLVWGRGAVDYPSHPCGVPQASLDVQVVMLCAWTRQEG